MTQRDPLQREPRIGDLVLDMDADPNIVIELHPIHKHALDLWRGGVYWARYAAPKELQQDITAIICDVNGNEHHT